MAPTAEGIHHITAIAGDPQRNLDFYAGFLGLRLVKRTVNFDDPGTYHFYFGDEIGRPGSLLTFFPWAGAFPGRMGSGEVGVVTFAVPAGALDFWRDRLAQHKLRGLEVPARFGEQAIGLVDPDGLRLELIASNRAPSTGVWSDSIVPAQYTIRGIHSATLTLASTGQTAALLTEALGFRPLGAEDNRHRFEAGAGGPGAVVDLRIEPDAPHALNGVGSVHHIAWRAAGESEQTGLREILLRRGVPTTPVIDRQYFRSIYFREPGGVLFEVATDGPGFLIDEPVESLGEALKLPAQYERNRQNLEAILPPLVLPPRGIPAAS
ncbi:MAG TPA: ring-cleaving dioxygenase [Gemmatimonadales bacterium]|nr:ring-cleaving dioxygenase [Gemmatimonadales bacterium]